MHRVFISAAAVTAVSGLASGLHGPVGVVGDQGSPRTSLTLVTPGVVVPSQAAPPVEVFQIGESSRGTPISVWRVAHPDIDELGRGPDDRPALLIVAGLDGRHDFGTRLALTLADRLAADHLALLRRYTVYIVPDMNPDNDALFDMAGIPRADFGRAPHSADADRDGRFDEDPAEDLNNDGIITMMRVKNPAPGTGLRATLVLDPDEPRTLREPKADEGEIAEYALLIEGIDNDNDGKYNEDGFAGSAGAGVDLDRNFPSLWPEFADGAGQYQLSEPETRSLVEWMLTRDNIICTLAYTPGDNILNMPATGKYAADGSEPTGIEKNDKAVYEKVQEVFKEATKQTGAPKGAWEGSFTQFAYAQFGVWSFATPAWVRPDLIKQDKAEGKEDEKGDDAGNDKPGKPDAPEASPDPDAERKALQGRGIPDFVIDFILASSDERAAMMAGFADMSEEEQASRMQMVTDLPEDVQLRMRALISGQPDPGAQAGASREGRGGRAAGRGNRPGGPGGTGSEKNTSKTPDTDEAQWIKYSDEHLDGSGFIEWTPFDHPQLGEVEIGGLMPGIRHEPPESEWSRVVNEQTEFIATLLGLMPEFAVETIGVERIAEGIWRIRIRGTNAGDFPTRAAIGVKARRIPPIVVSLRLEVDNIVSGQRLARWDTIAGHGDSVEVEWTIKAPDGSTVAVDIRSIVYGNRTLTIHLTEGE